MERTSIIKHKDYVNLIGNMTLLGEKLNLQASNNPFSRKQYSYSKSNFIITQQLCLQNKFKFNDVIIRSQLLTEMALEIWKI